MPAACSPPLPRADNPTPSRERQSGRGGPRHGFHPTALGCGSYDLVFCFDHRAVLGVFATNPMTRSHLRVAFLFLPAAITPRTHATMAAPTMASRAHRAQTDRLG